MGKTCITAITKYCDLIFYLKYGQLYAFLGSYANTAKIINFDKVYQYPNFGTFRDQLRVGPLQILPQPPSGL